MKNKLVQFGLAVAAFALILGTLWVENTHTNSHSLTIVASSESPT